MQQADEGEQKRLEGGGFRKAGQGSDSQCRLWSWAEWHPQPSAATAQPRHVGHAFTLPMSWFLPFILTGIRVFGVMIKEARQGAWHIVSTGHYYSE